MWGFGGSKPAEAVTVEDPGNGELTDLFGGTRESPVPLGVYVRFEKSVHNKQMAEQARRDRADRDAERARQRAALFAACRERRERMRGKNERTRQQLVQTKLETGRQVRELKRLEGERRAAEKAIEDAITKERSNAGRNNDARLDGPDAGQPILCAEPLGSRVLWGAHRLGT